MSSGVRIRNLPELANEQLIINFLTKVTTEIERVDIKDNYADVYLKEEDDLESILMLDGQELLGYSVEITNLNQVSDESLPEIQIEEAFLPKIQPTPNEIPNQPAKSLKLTEVPSKLLINSSNISSKLETPQQLRTLLQEIVLNPRSQLPENDSFRLIMDCKLAALFTMFTLIALTFADIFG